MFNSVQLILAVSCGSQAHRACSTVGFLMPVKDHIHVPSDTPVISDEMRRNASRFLYEVALGMHDDLDSRVLHNRINAARAVESLGQTQDRYTPDRLKQLASMPKASEGVRNLASLTPEKLARLEAEMTADYPGKPS